MNILYINPIGGLANRMRAMAAGICLARDLGVDFRIVWCPNAELHARFDEIFEVPELLKGKFIHPSPLTYSLLFSVPRKKNLYVSSITLRRYKKCLLTGRPEWHLTESDDPAKREVLSYFASCKTDEGNENYYIQGGTDYYPYSEKFYRSLFRPIKSIRERAASILADRSSPLIGVHIRRTDNIVSIDNSPENLFRDKMNRLLEEYPSIRFYLATDSEEVKENFKNTFGDSIRYGERKTSRDTLEGIRDALIEMYILAGCDAIYGSYFSSFSEAAAIIGDTKLYVVRK